MHPANSQMIDFGRFASDLDGSFFRERLNSLSYVQRFVGSLRAALLNEMPIEERPGVSAALHRIITTNSDEIWHGVRNDLQQRMLAFRQQSGTGEPLYSLYLLIGGGYETARSAWCLGVDARAILAAQLAALMPQLDADQVTRYADWWWLR